MVKINGVEMNIQGKTVSQYLAENDYDGKRVAVELNGDIVFAVYEECAYVKLGRKARALGHAHVFAVYENLKL